MRARRAERERHRGGVLRRAGWQVWTGTASVIDPGGVERSEEEGGIYLLPVTAQLDSGGDLACEWRRGDVW